MQMIITIEEKLDGIDVNIKANDFCTELEAKHAVRIREAIIQELAKSADFQENESTLKTTEIAKGNKNVH